MKVKQGMNGNGGGRWCKRDVAKRVCKKKRRSQDKKAIRAIE